MLSRRAQAPRLIEWTGERCVPWAPDIQVVYEHLHRYLWASQVLAGRQRVLDVGSGEGFGAAILAEAVEEVVGIDVDEPTVQHSVLSYGAPGLSFRVADATDLSMFEPGSFDAVVAFEVIEHIAEQELVLAQIERVLGMEGLLIVSTPDRRAYSEATGQQNPFHVRELTYEELRDLLAARFAHTAMSAQRSITGSHIAAFDEEPATSMRGDGAPSVPRTGIDWYVERAGEGWRLVPEAALMYVIAVASTSELPALPELSTLADFGLELLRVQERLVQSVAAERRADLHRLESIAAQVHDHERELASVRGQLAAAQAINRRWNESITVQLFQRIRGWVFAVLGGEATLAARGLRACVRLVGRVLLRSSKPRGADRSGTV